MPTTPIPKGTRKLCVTITKCCTEANSAGQHIERCRIIVRKDIFESAGLHFNKVDTTIHLGNYIF